MLLEKHIHQSYVGTISMAVNFAFKACHLSNVHLLLYLFLFISLSYASLRVFHLLS